MKDISENDRIDSEKLLRTKSWQQLTTEERHALSGQIEGEAEYERIRAMVHQLRSSSGLDDPEMVPSEHVRKNLLAAFDEEQDRKRLLWWNSLGFWFRDRLRLDIPAVRIAFAGVILFAGIYTLIRMMGDDAQPENHIAGNDQVQPLIQPVVDSNKQETDSILNKVPEQPVPAQEKNVVVGPAPNRVPQKPFVPPIIVPDTNGNKLALQANIPDTNAITPALAVGVNPVVCCGAGVTLNAASATNFTWTPLTNAGTPTFTGVDGNATAITVTVGPEKSRSLAQDAQLLDVFFAMK